MSIYKIINMYYLIKSHDSLKSHVKLNVDSLFNHRIMSWRKIVSNWFGSELFLVRFYYKLLVLFHFEVLGN